MRVYKSMGGYYYKVYDDIHIRISKKEYTEKKGGMKTLYKPSNHEISHNITKFIDYPYLRYIISKKTLMDKFIKAKTDNPIPVANKYDMSKQLTKLKQNDRLIANTVFISGIEYEILMQYFQEDATIMCNIEGSPSPWEIYHNPKYNIKWVGRYREKIINRKNIINELRIVLRQLYKKDCDAFPLNIALWIFNKFCPKKILMMCGGWGDAIIATMAYGKHTLLTAVDPNKNAVSGWYKMLNFYDPKNTEKYIFHVSPFESCVFEKNENKYDLMYACPPYFSAEHYSTDDDQSYLKYLTKEDWLNGFLKPSLKKVWELMATNGIVVLIINDVVINNKLIEIVQPTHDIMDSLPKSKYFGTWGFKKSEHQHTYQPIFCWIKTK